MTPPIVLTIAGSDSSGGAGIQADLRTFAAHAVHGATAITAVTAQNTLGVDAVSVVDVSMVVAQIESVLADVDPLGGIAATKTGMLATAEIVRAVGDLAAAGRLPNLVVDPVMISTSGARLLDPAAVDAYRDHLLPHAVVATPNRAEARALVGDVAEPTLAQAMADAGVLAGDGVLAGGADLTVVVTGGDAGTGLTGARSPSIRPSGTPGDPGSDMGGDAGVDVVDVVATAGAIHQRRSPRVDTRNAHGTGCSFASAIAARLAHGDDVLDAVDAARTFVHRALTGGATWRLGRGPGPIDHLGWEDQ